MIVEMAKTGKGGHSLTVDQCTADRAGLAWHWNHALTREQIESKKWDYVVLQDRSGGPLEERSSFATHAELLHHEIKRQGSKTVFYMTWANQSRPQTHGTIADAYIEITKKLCAMLVPVGLAWHKVVQHHPEMGLYHCDGRHANAAGSYLVACVFFAHFFQADPIGLPRRISVDGKLRANLTPDQAKILQKAAVDVLIKEDHFPISLVN